MSATITWLGHATFKLTLPDDRVVMIDPWLANNPSCPENLKNLSRCDIVVLTHAHFDHAEDIQNIVEEFDPMVVGTLELCAVLEKQLGKGRYSAMNTGGTQIVDGVSVSLTQAFHSSSFASPEGPLYAGMPNGVVVGYESLSRIYHAGDTDVFGDMRLIQQIFEPAVSILPIGDHFTMGAKGAAIAAELLQPSTVVPCHYKSFPLLAQSTDAFMAALSNSLREKVLVVEVGQELAWTSTGIG